MSASDSPRQPGKPPKIRRDGWTPERQLRFLDSLARTRSITRSAAFAGMSRESTYRLRNRRDGALFAAAWDRILQTDGAGSPEVRNRVLSDGRLARLLGSHFRRQQGDFAAIGSRPFGRRATEPTRTS